jgi:hypothetical protein
MAAMTIAELPLDDLRRELERAEFALERADYCENTDRRDRERASARRRIDEITAQIARIEESF